jgi:hypothetical protein
MAFLTIRSMPTQENCFVPQNKKPEAQSNGLPVLSVQGGNINLYTDFHDVVVGI